MTGSVAWAKKWHEYCRVSGEMAQEINPETGEMYDIRHAAHIMMIAGSAAGQIFGKLKKNSWAKKAMKCYETAEILFEEYLKSNEDTKAEKKLEEIRRSIVFYDSKNRKK